jgi:hypothetical protein
MYILTDAGVRALGKPKATLQEITDYFTCFVDMVKIVIQDGAIVAQSKEAPPVILGFTNEYQD